MKQKLQRYLALGLAVWVLCTSTGISLYEHICHFTGKVELSAELPEMCCPKPKSTAGDNTYSKGSCCETQLTLIQLKAVSLTSLEKVQVPAPSAWLLTTPSYFLDPQPIFSWFAWTLPQVTGLPPLRQVLSIFLRVANLRL